MRNWRNTKIIGFDTETTGLDPERDRIVQMAFLVDDPKKGQKEWCSLCGLDGAVLPPKVSEIHGIWPEHLEDKATATEQAKDLYEWLVDEVTPHTVFLAYNAPFDLAFLLCTFRRARLPFPIDPHNVLDPLAFARTLWSTNKLWELAKRLDIKNEKAHDAMADTRTTVQSMLSLVEKMKLPDDIDAALVQQEEAVKTWERKMPYKYREQLIAVGGWSLPVDGRW